MMREDTPWSDEMVAPSHWSRRGPFCARAVRRGSLEGVYWLSSDDMLEAGSAGQVQTWSGASDRARMSKLLSPSPVEKTLFMPDPHALPPTSAIAETP